MLQKNCSYQSFGHVKQNTFFYFLGVPLFCYFFSFVYFVLGRNIIVYLYRSQIYVNNNDNNKDFSEKSRVNTHINAYSL